MGGMAKQPNKHIEVKDTTDNFIDQIGHNFNLI